MEIKVKVNFDFGKLANSMPNIVNKYVEGYVKETEVQTKKNIDRSKDKFGGSLKINYRKGQPLFDTGSMYNSIKQNKKSLSIKKYGYLHDRGEVPTLRSTSNTSNFIDTTPENKQKIDQQFIKSVKSSLKK